MKGLAWLALVVAIIALILGWVAYNRAGADLEDQIQAAVDEAVMELRAELEQAENEIEEEVAEEVTEPEDQE